VTGVSVLGAAEKAIADVKERLFPFRLPHWLLLGLVSFLEQCGSGGSSGFFPPGPGGNVDEDLLPRAGDWLGSHVVLAILVSVLVLTVIVVALVVTTWLSSRGVVMYVEAVATGGTDVVGSFSRSGEAANSLFAWRFLASLGTFVALLVTVGTGIVLALSARSGNGATAVMSLLACVALAFLALAIVVAGSLFALALVDFAAPIQWSRKVSCGEALGLLLPPLRLHGLSFLGYVLLKAVVGAAAGVALLFACCLCCLAVLPVISHTLLQPVFFFQRAFANRLLEQMGFEIMRPLHQPGPPPGTAPLGG
jgi:hypothetical protein